MGSGIEWTTDTWNPLTGCDKVSEGCTLCYAEGTSQWQKRLGTDQYQNAVDENGRFAGGEVTVVPEKLTQPLRWTKPRRIFVNSVSDLFHDDVPFEFQCAVYAVMALSKGHIFQVLTKRPDNMRSFFVSLLNQGAERKDGFSFDYALPNGYIQPQKATNLAIDIACEEYHELEKYLSKHGYESTITFPAENVFLGTSTENQEALRERVFDLLRCPADLHWLSCEPLVNSLDLHNVESDEEMWPGRMNVLTGRIFNHAVDKEDEVDWMNSIDWVVAGGESKHDELGEEYPEPRPMHPEWLRKLRSQCVGASVPFFFKQWGAWAPMNGRDLKGEPETVGHWRPDTDPLTDTEPLHESDTGEFFYDGHITSSNYPHMGKFGKDETGNILDGLHYLNFPKVMQ